jgi:carboxypeptidase Q
MLRKWLAPAVVFGLAIAAPAAQGTTEKIDTEMNARIRKEGMENSQIMRIMHHLTDVYGPRVTGSPNHEAAAKWIVDEMTRWGFKNGKLEPFEFKITAANGTVTRPTGGWLNEKASGHIIAPVKDNLVFEVLAWTPSTKGTVTSSAVHLVTPQGPETGAAGAQQNNCPVVKPRFGPTDAQLTEYFASIKSKINGAVVFVGPQTCVPFVEAPGPKRQTEEQWKGRLTGAGGGGRGNAPAGGGRGGNQAAQPPAGTLTAADVATKVNAFLLANGAAVRVNDAGREHGQIRAFQYNAYDPTKTVPTVVMRNEDYGRITRLIAGGSNVRLEFNIVNKHFPAGKTSYNAVAEIPGTDKADEVVMLGGHLDSWHSATGATDNAIGVATMMEAARILNTLGVKPRRTIRVVGWGGEEQGLLGSKAYVEQHFGTAENPKPEFAKFNGYFNIDGGTGQFHLASIFGPAEAGTVLTQFLKQFEDIGVYGATTTSARTSGGTDSTSFNAAGLPGIGLNQDGIEYNSHTWHTNLDTYERIVEQDVKRSAIAIASAVYHIAMRDQMLPRFTKETMPPVPGAGRGGGPAQR